MYKKVSKSETFTIYDGNSHERTIMKTVTTEVIVLEKITRKSKFTVFMDMLKLTPPIVKATKFLFDLLNNRQL
ncbi:MAG: hypothetical protein KBT36_11175 [Kurthia sp.]|nr:hypothetical protein [Candidatus Kurthia equi]